MALQVKLSATLRAFVPDYDPLRGLEIPLQDARTISDVLSRLNIPEEKIRVVMRNGVAAKLSQPVEDGDRLGFFPPIGGG